MTDGQERTREPNVTPEQLWHATNNHIRDLMEMVEGRLQNPAGCRRWRLAMSAFARRALVQVGVKLDEPILDMLEDWVDDTLSLITLRAAYARQHNDSGLTRPETAEEWARSAALGAAYTHGEAIHLFDALLWQQAENAFPDPAAERIIQATIFKDIFGNPFRPVAFNPQWRSEIAVSLARTDYDTRNFTLLPILADALEESGCDNADVLAHCRDPKQIHVRGCWVVDGVLGKS